MNQFTHTTTGFRRWSWIASDAWTITQRDLRHWLLQPGPVILGWVFPIMVVLMFSGLFGGAIGAPQGSRYIEFLMPGMFAITMLFGLETTMLAVTTDVSKGVTDRFRSLPISAATVVLGRCVADMLNSVVGLSIMLVTGFVLGWRWHAGIESALAAIGLLLLLRFALLWVGIYMGLRAKGPEAVVAVQILVWPFSFLSNVFVDPASMPAWLGTLARWNPLSATASAVRTLFGNPGFEGASGIDRNAPVMAALWPVLISVLFLILSVRAFRRLGR